MGSQIVGTDHCYSLDGPISSESHVDEDHSPQKLATSARVTLPFVFVELVSLPEVLTARVTCPILYPCAVVEGPVGFRNLRISMELVYLPSLKLTANAPENGWLEYDCFLLGPGLFSGAFAVSFRECRLVRNQNSAKMTFAKQTF